MPGNRMIQVLIVDDHGLVRRNLRSLLEKVADIKVVGEAENGAEAVEYVRKLQPDIVIMDIAMPELDGFQATERIQALEVSAQVLVLTMHMNDKFVHLALQKGARGYVLKRKAGQELVAAIRTVNQGEIYLSKFSAGFS
ncbi:MAG: response regulator transcription factor [Candidatus Promineifilaceae bacterium]